MINMMNIHVYKAYPKIPWSMKKEAKRAKNCRQEGKKDKRNDFNYGEMAPEPRKLNDVNTSKSE